MSSPAITKPTGATILGRALEAKGGQVPPEGARFILNLGIREQDRLRLLNLLERKQEGRLTVTEGEELASYIEADNVLSILKTRALLALKSAGQEP